MGHHGNGLKVVSPQFSTGLRKCTNHQSTLEMSQSLEEAALESLCAARHISIAAILYMHTYP